MGECGCECGCVRCGWVHGWVLEIGWEVGMRSYLYARLKGVSGGSFYLTWLG